MTELQSRRYKEVTPKETIKTLKNKLEEMGIEVEENWKHSSIETYSLRLCVKGTNIGQNGKGMTREFAMASAYAEFFERFQNNMLRFRTEKPTKELPFSSYPDEKYLSLEELMSSDNSVLENVLKLNKYENKSKQKKIKFLKNIFDEDTKLKLSKNNATSTQYLSLPYYNVKNNNIEYIPEQLFYYLFATNGMCAGNSKEEALIEGISEILERYVAIKIAKEKLTLPEIPMSYLENFPKVKQMLEKINANENYYSKLIDCSLGGKYPVAGLYILEKNTGKFGYKMGAHPDYGIAMERCFTEAAQGVDIYDYAQTCIFDFFEQSENEEENLTKFLLSDYKAVPYQIIAENVDYNFTQMPDVSNLDNKTILKNMIDSIIKEDKQILIRDVSSLGFPAFSVVIPSMSETNYDQTCKYLKIENKMKKLLSNFKNINLNNIKEVIEMMEIMVNEVGVQNLSAFINIKDESTLPCESINMGGKYFLAIAYIMDKQYSEAVKILEDLTYMADSLITNQAEKIIIKSVYYYTSAMCKFKSHEKAMYYINLLFDEQISEVIDMSFKDRNEIFANHYGITEDDFMDDDDSYYLPFMKKLREAQNSNIIDQMINKEIFSSIIFVS